MNFTSMFNKRNALVASRALFKGGRKWAIGGAAIGGTLGALDNFTGDRKSILGGAMQGAFTGIMARGGMSLLSGRAGRYRNPRFRSRTRP